MVTLRYSHLKEIKKKKRLMIFFSSCKAHFYRFHMYRDFNLQFFEVVNIISVFTFAFVLLFIFKKTSMNICKIQKRRELY